MEEKRLRDFIVMAKVKTYAGDGELQVPSRPSSKDLVYREGDLLYIDSYLGGSGFIGEEAVWENNRPVWGMNYRGKMLVSEIPHGFSEFLKASLRTVTQEAPYRGPRSYSGESFEYQCNWKGNFDYFSGSEGIMSQGKLIYVLDFHGGIIE